jgi:uncharacterized oxidoreductase
MGQHKGYALAFMCELLAGTLSGAGAMPTPPRDGSGMVNNLLSLLFDPERWDATDELRREAEALIVYLHGTTPVDREKPVLVPGEPERDARRDNEALGIPLPEATLAALMALAR